MSIWADLDDVGRYNIVQEARADGWLLVSSDIDYEAAAPEPVFLAPDGSLRFLDGSSAPLPVTVNSGVWTDPDSGPIGFAAGARWRIAAFILLAVAGLVAVVAVARKKG